MSENFRSFLYRTRGLHLFLPLVISIMMKQTLGGTTPVTMFMLGMTFIVVFQAFRMYSASYLWGRQAVVQPEADFLCTSGPYAYVRNPLYLGNLLIGIAVSITIFEWYAFALFFTGYVFVYATVIPYEEKFLERRFGTVYADYAGFIPRLIPRSAPYESQVKVAPNYRAGILGEVHVPLFLVILELIIYMLFVK